MPPEYCEYYPGYEQCKIWLEKNCPDLLEQLTVDDAEEGDGKKKSKSQKRGIVFYTCNVCVWFQNTLG